VKKENKKINEPFGSFVGKEIKVKKNQKLKKNQNCVYTVDDSNGQNSNKLSKIDFEVE
jgi:hypothetical protein